MNFTAQVACDTFRCSAIAGVAFAIGWPLGRAQARTRVRMLCLLAPLLTPTLLLSYAAAPIAQRCTGAALAAFYSVVLALRLAPLAALARACFPSPLSAEGAHCARLLERSTAERAWFAVRAAGPVPWAALALIFLLAFTDFEFAALLGVKTWPVMLFDAHAGGLAIGESLRRIAWPAAVQLAALAPVAMALRAHAGGKPALRSDAAPPAGPAVPLLLAILLAALPLARIAWLAAPGLASLRVQEVFAADLLVSLGFATGAALGAWLLTGLVVRTRPAERAAPSSVIVRDTIAADPRPRWPLGVVILPGLLGALVLSLLVLALIQSPALRGLRDTPLPLLLADALLLAPLALLLRALLRALTPREALHLARMAGSRRLVWDLAIQPRAGALALLFMLAYFEFTAATILAPIGMTPVFARLHNLAHYGQTAVLSALMLAAVVAPVALLALTLGAARLYARRDVP